MTSLKAFFLSYLSFKSQLNFNCTLLQDVGCMPAVPCQWLRIIGISERSTTPFFHFYVHTSKFCADQCFFVRFYYAFSVNYPTLNTSMNY